MSSMNKVFLLGNLTKDPEVRNLPSGSHVATLRLAINDRYKWRDGEYKEQVTYVDVEVFGRTADNASKYLSKGRGVLVEGALRLDTWEDKDGKKQSRLKVHAFRVDYLPGREQGNAAELHDEESATQKGRPEDVGYDDDGEILPF